MKVVVEFFASVREAVGAGELGIGLPEADTWGQGYGTEAVRLLLGYLFHGMGLAEVRTATWTGNARMMRVAQKCGFSEVDRYPHEARVTVRGEPLVIVEFTLYRTRWEAQSNAEEPSSRVKREAIPRADLGVASSKERWMLRDRRRTRSSQRQTLVSPMALHRSQIYESTKSLT